MSQELLKLQPWYFREPSNGQFYYSSEGLVLNSPSIWITTDYISVPQGSNIIYTYNFEYSKNENNSVYIQVERYDENKNAVGSNNGVSTIVSGNTYKNDQQNHIIFQSNNFPSLGFNSSNNKKVYFIKVRISCGYGDNSTDKYCILHNYSIKAINLLEQQNLEINKNAILGDYFEEGFSQFSSTKYGTIRNNIIYEY